MLLTLLFLLLQYVSDDCKNVIHSAALSTFSFIAVDKIDCVYNGSCVLMTLSHVASVIMQHKSGISKLKHTVGEVGMSVMNEDYGVGNILARL